MQKLEKLEEALENKFPTPQVILDLLAKEKELTDRQLELLCVEHKTDEEQAEYDMLLETVNNVSANITISAIKENHMLTLVRNNIFIADLTDAGFEMLTKVPGFGDQLFKHESKLFDEAMIETLLANGIETAEQFENLIESYFDTKNLQDVKNYRPLDESLEKFVGIELTENLNLDYDETFTDEDTGESVTFPRNKLLLTKGTVTEQALIDADHDEIMTALQNQLDDVIADENYEMASVLQTQLDKLK